MQSAHRSLVNVLKMIQYNRINTRNFIRRSTLLRIRFTSYTWTVHSILPHRRHEHRIQRREYTLEHKKANSRHSHSIEFRMENYTTCVFHKVWSILETRKKNGLFEIFEADHPVSNCLFHRCLVWLNWRQENYPKKLSWIGDHLQVRSRFRW